MAMRAEPVEIGQTQSSAASAVVPFKVFSFLPCSRSEKKSPAKGNNYKKDGNGVLVIPDSDDEMSNDNAECEYELLCEIEFDADTLLPRPIECKVECKEEPQQNDCNQDTSTIELGDGEDELLTLCKLEPICDLSETLAAATPNGDDNHYILFICPQCGQSFDCHGDWRRHILAVHQLNNQQKWNFKRRPNNEFECTKCQMVVTRCTLKTLQQHHFTHLPYKMYKCKLCPYEAHSFFLMISHIMLHKDREEVSATVSSNKMSARQQTAEQESLWLHESRASIAFICPACGITFDDEEAWQAHINFSHNFLEKTAENRFGDHFKCTDCNVEIFSQHVADLQQHLFTHLPYKSFLKCKICNWTISRRNFMLSHILNLHKRHLSVAVNNVSTSATGPDENTIKFRMENPPDLIETTRRSTININNDITAMVTKLGNKQARKSITIESPSTPLSASEQSQSDPKPLKLKPSFRCENCSKKYYYERSFRKHIQYCKLSIG